MSKSLRKIIIMSLCLFLLGCATTLAPKANNQEQEKVKQEVLNLLEKEYSQPFKIIDYSYNYGTHYPAGNSTDPRILEYGAYKFKIQAVDKPYVSLGVRIDDDGKDFMNDFRKTYLPVFYCGALGGYFDDLRINHIKNTNKEELNKAEELCNSRNQSVYYEKYKSEYLKSIQ
jgi:hypothetical protein